MDPDDFVLKHGVDKYQALFNKLLDPFQFQIYYQKIKTLKSRMILQSLNRNETVVS